jgi:hypothetical protein
LLAAGGAHRALGGSHAPQSSRLATQSNTIANTIPAIIPIKNDPARKPTTSAAAVAPKITTTPATNSPSCRSHLARTSPLPIPATLDRSSTHTGKNDGSQLHRRWEVYVRGTKIGEVYPATERAACVRAVLRFKISREDQEALEVRRLRERSPRSSRPAHELRDRGGRCLAAHPRAAARMCPRAGA